LIFRNYAGTSARLLHAAAAVGGAAAKPMPANRREHRRDRRYAANQSAKRRVVVIVRDGVDENSALFGVCISYRQLRPSGTKVCESANALRSQLSLSCISLGAPSLVPSPSRLLCSLNLLPQLVQFAYLIIEFGCRIYQDKQARLGDLNTVFVKITHRNPHPKGRQCQPPKTSSKSHYY
jgi:hypothetical protein